MTKQEFIAAMVPAALASGHPYPLYAVCEAALESGWANSKLAIVANNLFGQKQGMCTQGFDTIEIPTREYNAESKQWYTTTATWPKFPDYEWSFRERYALLQRLAIYGDALTAASGEEFIQRVSVHWSTDPERAHDVIQTYHCNAAALQQAELSWHASHLAEAITAAPAAGGAAQ